MDAPHATLLHLEDSDLDAEFVKSQLNKSDLRIVVERVSDRRGFTDRLQAKTYDLILSDYQVPSFEGLAALDLAKQYQPATPFIFVSGAMGEEIAVESLKRGAIDYVLKQRLARLPSAVERALAEARERAEHKKAEQALRESEERLSEVFRRAPSFMCVLRGPEHVFELANERYYQLVGPRDLIGKPIREALPEVVDHFELLDVVYRSGETFSGSCMRFMVRRDPEQEPEVRYLDCVYQALRDVDGDITGILVNGVDQTERMRAEAAVRKGETRLRSILDSVPEKVFTARADGNMDYFNPHWIEYTGLSFDEMRNWGWVRCIHPDDVETNLLTWRQSIAGGEVFQCEHRLRRRDGSYRWHLSRARAIEDDNDEIALWVGSTTDIHDVKTAQDALARSAAAEKQRSTLLAAVADASQAVNAVLSVDSIIHILAEQAQRILAADVAIAAIVNDRETGQMTQALAHVDARAPDDDAKAAFDKLAHVVCGGTRPLRLSAGDFERHPACAGANRIMGRRWLGVPLIDQAGNTFGLIQVADARGSEFSEEDEAVLVQLAHIAAVGIENSRLYDSLREQDKRKDEFLATLAHELRNPLAPVRTGLQILKVAGECELSDKTRDMMERQVAHMVRLVDDLMDVSRITRGTVALRKERVELRSVIEAAIEASRPQIESAGQRLDLSLPDDAVVLEADPTRLAQVLNNLLNNASKYNAKNGRIQLDVELREAAVQICVSDDGVGIPPDMLGKVFDMFLQVGSTLDHAQGGLGIGLTIVKRLVEMHGGTVKAESRGTGQGSAFTVTLPRALESDGEGNAPTRSDHRAPALAVQPLRVLIVDDNTDGAETLASLVRMWGHEAGTAHTGPDAVAAARALQPDILFLDIGLPGMNGYEVARRLREEASFARTTLVALTGWGSEEDRRKSKGAGFDHHLTKPVEYSKVAELLAGVTLGRGRYPPAPGNESREQRL